MILSINLELENIFGVLVIARMISGENFLSDGNTVEQLLTLFSIELYYILARL